MNRSELNRRLPEAVSVEAFFADRAQIHGIMPFGDVLVAEPKTRGNSRVKAGTKHQESRFATLVKCPIETGNLIIQELAKKKIGSKPFCFHVSEKNENSFIVQGMNFKEEVVPEEKYTSYIPSILSKKASRLNGFKMGGIEFSGIWIAFPLKGNALAKARQEMKSLGMAVAGALTSILRDPVELAKFTGLKDKNNRKIDIYLELGRWD